MFHRSGPGRPDVPLTRSRRGGTGRLACGSSRESRESRVEAGSEPYGGEIGQAARPAHVFRFGATPFPQVTIRDDRSLGTNQTIWRCQVIGCIYPPVSGCVGAYLGSHFTGEGAERVRRGTERLAGLVLVTLATFLFTGTLQVA